MRQTDSCFLDRLKYGIKTTEFFQSRMQHCQRISYGSLTLLTNVQRAQVHLHFHVDFSSSSFILSVPVLLSPLRLTLTLSHSYFPPTSVWAPCPTISSQYLLRQLEKHSQCEAWHVDTRVM